MAGNPIVEVKRAFIAALAGEDLGSVQLSYSFRGAEHCMRLVGDVAAGVWLDGASTDYGVHAMKAGRRRRDMTPSFTVVVAVFMAGASLVDEVESETLQQRCDERAEEIVTVIDEYIADNQQLASPELIEWALITRTAQTASGPITIGGAAGVGCRVEITVECKAAPL